MSNQFSMTEVAFQPSGMHELGIIEGLDVAGQSFETWLRYD